MAETCIVCLGDLVLHDESAAPPATSDGADLPASAPGTNADTDTHVDVDTATTEKDAELVAHLLPCGHNLHNECLKPWVERANSCPICRASFNMVELSARVGGPMISSYGVQDKQQVAEIDPSMIVDDDDVFEDDGSYDACMVCDEFGDSSQLMYCHSCEQLCHVFCAGLDRMPSRGPWYCQGCVENPELIAAATQRGVPRGPAAFINGRSRMPRRAGAPDDWVGVWQSVWDRLHFDLEFPFEDEEQSENRSEAQRRENAEWERRFALARSMGAGNRFRAAADNVHMRQSSSMNRHRPANRALHREGPKSPKDPESQEELRAWNQFEKARGQLAGPEDAPTQPSAGPSNSRRRKRKSADSSPIEPDMQDSEPGPERKLKRPRTRLNNAEPAESSTAAARRNTIPSQRPTPPNTTKDTAEPGPVGPGFLQSLLKEVEVDRFAEQDREIAAPQPRRVIVERACSPQNSSPGLSPVFAGPRAMLATPPPFTLNRTKSPQQADDAQLSPTYSPFSPADDDGRQDRRKLALRSAGLTSPPRSKDSSPTRSSSLSYSTKAELQRMVTVVLKPLYLKKEITKEQYTGINRDVSRLLYERVGDAGADALADHDTREIWQKMAGEEVDIAIKNVRSNPASAASAADDSASSSS